MKRIFWVMGYHVVVLGFDPATNKRELDFILVHAEKDIWKEINKTEWDSYLIVHLHILTLGIFLRSLSLWFHPKDVVGISPGRLGNANLG